MKKILATLSSSHIKYIPLLQYLFGFFFPVIGISSLVISFKKIIVIIIVKKEMQCQSCINKSHKHKFQHVLLCIMITAALPHRYSLHCTV